MDPNEFSADNRGKFTDRSTLEKEVKEAAAKMLKDADPGSLDLDDIAQKQGQKLRDLLKQGGANSQMSFAK